MNDDPTDEAEVADNRRPAEIVSRFLQELEARDLEAAAALLAPGATMVFPGGASFGRLEDLVEWARHRYARARKRIERIDVADAAEGDAVFCQGTLDGEWLDGTTFDGIRFADWFLIREGRIVRQEVWNDLAVGRHD